MVEEVYRNIFRIGVTLPENPLKELNAYLIRAKNWEEFPATQKFFAFGECLSHLDYHLRRGHLTRTKEDGIWRYTAA